MSNFSAGQIAALRALLELWPDKPVTLVGASALGCAMDMRWRTTYDLDVSVAISIKEYPAGLETLVGWSRHPALEHEWLAPQNIKVDIIPAGPELLKAGRLVWPESGMEMSLIAFRLAFEYSETIAIARDLSVQVAPVPVIAVLKTLAYQDRPTERRADLEDLAYILEDYLPPEAEERFSEKVIRLNLSYEETSSFLLGQRIAAIANDPEKQAVLKFISKVEDDEDPHGTQARMASLGPPRWNRDPETLLQRIRAFKLGLG